jgi:hypothetical protein
MIEFSVHKLRFQKGDDKGLTSRTACKKVTFINFNKIIVKKGKRYSPRATKPTRKKKKKKKIIPSRATSLVATTQPEFNGQTRWVTFPGAHAGRGHATQVRQTVFPDLKQKNRPEKDVN